MGFLPLESDFRPLDGALGFARAWTAEAAVSTWVEEDGASGNFLGLIAVPLVRGTAMYCNYCGKVIQDDAAVCAYCGIRVGASVARKRLVRPRQGRKVAGVCLGCAEYFDIDVTVVRLAWLITALMTCVGFIPYIVAWIVMPEEPPQLMAPAGAQQMTSV